MIDFNRSTKRNKLGRSIMTSPSKRRSGNSQPGGRLKGLSRFSVMVFLLLCLSFVAWGSKAELIAL